MRVKAKDSSTSDYEVSIKVQKLRYGFAAKATMGKWSNQSREKMRFGLDSGDRGRVLSRDGIKLEDGSIQNNVIEMRPMLGGSVSGAFRLSTAIQRGDTFRTALGYAEGNNLGKVILRGVFQREIKGRIKETRGLFRIEKTYNEWVPEWE
jgi:hypothetical protein